jgi:hypothetical protein
VEDEAPGFGEHKFQISGVKSPEELEDDIAALAVWVWSMKDYLKKLAPSVGRLPNEVDSRCLPNGFRVQAISQGSEASETVMVFPAAESMPCGQRRGCQILSRFFNPIASCCV